MARVFISYKRVDKAKVFKLKDTIETAIGEECWIDLDGIESDAMFKSVIIKAINESEIFLFMYSRAHSTIEDFEHDWTVRELTFAELKKKRIVFINIDGSTLSDLFLFDYANKQQVDATSPQALDRLCTDLQKWLGCSTQSTTKQSNQAESLTTSDMVKLGKDYYFGENGKQKDYVKAVEWFRKAAEQGNDVAQVYLAMCYQRGQGVIKDFAEAVKWCRKAAEQGHAYAQCELGYCYFNGVGVAKNLSEAFSWFRKSALQGYAVAQSNLGVCYEHGYGVAKNKSEAIIWYRKAAEQGYSYAKAKLKALGINL